MIEPSPDPRPRVLWWAGVALACWLGVVAVLARVYWQGVLLALVAHGLLVTGVVWGTVVVAGRRDPTSAAPAPAPPMEPGAPRKRVPSLEASAAAVLVPSLLSVLIAVAGLIYILPEVSPTASERGLMLAALVPGVALLALVGRYAARADLPLKEGPGLLAWTRSATWMAAAAGVTLAIGGIDRPEVADLGVILPPLSGVGFSEGAGVLLSALALSLAVEPLARSAPGLWAWWNLREAPRPTDLPAARTLLVRLFFSDPHPVRSAFRVLDDTLGIDIRSSWALSFVRRALGPSLMAVCLLGWSTTGLVMVDIDEQAVRERFGRATDQTVLGPGLHLVWPWPVDRVRRVSTERVRTLPIGHEEEADVPEELLYAIDPGDADDEDAEDDLQSDRDDDAESRLWAKQHADEEYTLLLGDGRDLVTVDAQLHYRVRDARAWLYGMQNPEAALRSLAYRAVMERVIAQTLDEALGQDFGAFARDLEVQIQEEADRHALGVEVVDVILGALHPPVSVAKDYQGVVSAQIMRDTERIGAAAYRTGRMSEARREVVREVAIAEALAAERRASAVGEAEAFLGLRARVRTAEADYRFRRRMEALATNLDGRSLVILDHRLERDGMAVWLQPGP